MAEDHVGDLKKARDELIRQRRASISALTEGSKHTEHQLDTLIRYEQAIEHAITEEQIALRRAHLARFQVAPPVQAVPEPSTWAMMLLGFAGLGFAFRKSRRKVPAQVGTLVSAA